MATRNPLARALASAASRLWFPAARLTARSVPRPLVHRAGTLSPASTTGPARNTCERRV